MSDPAPRTEPAPATDPAPVRPVPPGVMDGMAVLLLIADSPAGGTAIVLRRPQAPSFVVLGDDSEEGFARLRRGAIAYGVQELYTALPRDMIRGGHTLHVRRDHRPARVDRSGSLLGPSPDKLWVPLDDDGTPFERMWLPLPSLERPAHVEFTLAAEGDVLEYTLSGEAALGDGFVCAYCGKLTATKETHTAAHGVSGHLLTGVPAGQQDDTAHPRQSSGPDTGSFPSPRDHSTGSRL